MMIPFHSLRWKMKRCRSMGTYKIVLVLTSFFIFTLMGCGIPTYINLDGNISWQREASHVDGTELSWKFSLNQAGIAKMSAVTSGPGIKLFYTLTPEPSKNAFGFVFGSDSISIENRFDTYFRKSSSGNGLDWRAGTISAPGFYLFSRSATSTGAPFSLIRPNPEDINLSALRVLVGTFAMNTDGIYNFMESPEMDFAIPKSTGTVSFTIRRSDASPENENFTELLLEVGGMNEIPLRNYIKATFPVANESNLHISNDDEDYFSYFSNPSDAKYIHIWASLYGGKGDFSNTYWSSLTYLGKIDLL